MASGNVPSADGEELRIVLLGKTGAGKSAVGNIILGKKVFASKISAFSVTAECQKEKGFFDGKKLTVIDTPGLLNTNKTNEEVVKEIDKCISMAAPGPHVFVIVTQAGRFTREDQETLETIQTMFGEKSLKYSMVVFTHRDQLGDDGDFIEKWIKENQTLNHVIRKYWGGYHVLDDRNKNPKQVHELLDKISNMVKNYGGSFYTNEMFEEAKKACIIQ